MVNFKKVYEKAREHLNDNADNSSMIDEASGLPRGLNETAIPGIYTNAEDRSFDPRDCSHPRNATSPFCGYNPISTKPVGLDVSFNKTQCGINAHIQPTLGFIELPPVDISYINENCRAAYDAATKPDEVKQPTAPPGQTHPSKGTLPSDGYSNLNPRCQYLIELAPNVPDGATAPRWQRGASFKYFDFTSYGRRFYGWFTGVGNPIAYESQDIIRFNGCVILLSHQHMFYDDPYNGRIADTYYTDENGACITTSIVDFDRYNGWQNWMYGTCEKLQQATRETYIDSWYDTVSVFRRSAEAFWMKKEYSLTPGYASLELNFSTFKTGVWIFDGGQSPNFFLGSGKDINAYFNLGVFDVPQRRYSVVGYKQLECEFDRRYNLPPHVCHPSRKDNCCEESNPYAKCYGVKDVGCCEDKNQELLALLKKIDKKIGDFPRKVEVWDDNPNAQDRQKKSKQLESVSQSFETIAKLQNDTLQIIGIEEFPITYPESIVEPQSQNGLERFWNWLNPKKNRKIKNIVQLIDWGIDQDSAQMGKWQQYVEYDKVVKGKTTKEKVVLPDVATTLRELFKMVASVIQVNGMQSDIEVKTLQNSVNNSVMLTKIALIVEDIQEYLDHITEEQTTTYPAPITPNDKSKSLEQYLQPSNIRIKYQAHKASNDTTLQEELDDIKMTLSNIRMQLGGERD